MTLEAELARAAAGDIPPRHLRVVVPDLSPDGQRAGALVLYDTAPEEAPFEAFFERWDGDEWVERGQTDGPGPGGWDFGDLAYPYLSGRVEDAVIAVDLWLGPTTIRRPVIDGWVLGVFWEAGLPADEAWERDDRVPSLARRIR
jgi:hypothetical protein